MESKKPIITPSCIGQYYLLHTIGEGGYSIVKVAEHKVSGERYACKIIPKTRLINEEMEHRFENEIRYLQQLNHNSIAVLIDLYKDSLNYYIIMELCEFGNLFDYVISKQNIEENEVKIIFRKILLVIDYIHGMGIAHRDIKLENILIDSYNNIKLIDFGFSVKNEEGKLHHTMCGTITYASPEILSGSYYNPITSDYWSLGVVLYILLTGKSPWNRKNPKLLSQDIIQGDYYIPSSISQEAANIIRGFLQVDPSKRITPMDALKSSWFSLTEYPNLLPILHKGRSLSVMRVNQFFNSDNIIHNQTHFHEGKVMLAAIKRRYSRHTYQ